MLVRVGSDRLQASEGAIYGILGNATEFLEQLDPAGLTVFDRNLPRLERERALSDLEQARRKGATVLLASHDEALLERMADELWWIEGSGIRERGAPSVILAKYRADVASKLRTSTEAALEPSMRRGDGRASVEKVELLGEDGAPTLTWRSGEQATIRVSVQFAHEVADPVIGILIRTRIGLNVYGTNTQLEKLHFGPVHAHNAVRLNFRFACDLCPGEYTLTVASHDPDGTWHDWLEDAVAFTVTDSRYTAGVANLRATVEVAQNI